MKASRNNHKEVVETLLENGALTDVLNYEQMKARDTTLNVEVDEMLAATEDTVKGKEERFNSHDTHAPSGSGTGSAHA